MLVNGLSIPSLIWRDVAPALAQKGFRVLLYGELYRWHSLYPVILNDGTDLYGRGYSDAPQRPYDTSLYVTQLALLMQHVRWEKAHIAGLSMVRFHHPYHLFTVAHFG